MSTGTSGPEASLPPQTGGDQPIDAQHATKSPFVDLVSLIIGSMGVVYGDIGTSPLYALREAVMASGARSNGVVVDDIMGVLSLILWTLFIIVTLKYVVILLRADNNGEGGTLSLMALAQRAMGRTTQTIFLLGVCGAALFFGDAVITPAISVLSAIEGLKLITPTFDPYILVITMVIIFILFGMQSRGTASIAAWFGPVMVVWFLTIAIGGALHIFESPQVFHALNPYYAIHFLMHKGFVGLVALGAVFLAVTGAEALYADLGHFGRKPIQKAWSWVVFPALVLNYMGQSALLLHHPEALENPFFLLFPDWALLPMVVLATAATIIASQAVISGAYSLARQAIQLKLLPRLHVLHTSAVHQGQIFMPQINLMLLIGVLLLVLLFGSSDRLATAYGIAVTGTMVVTAGLTFIVAWRHWHWPIWAAGLLMAPFMCIDLVFLAANMLKVIEGGYVPLGLAAAFMIVMWTWVRGNNIIFEKTRRDDIPLNELVERLEKKPPVRVPGTAVFLTADPETSPPALLHSLKHYKVLHEKNVMLTIVTLPVPRINDADRVQMMQVSETFSRVSIKFGYMEEPNVPRGLALCRKLGWRFDIMSTSFFLSRRSIKISPKGEMPLWQEKLFIGLSHNAADASEYFHIPTGRVVEIGTQIGV